MDVVPVLGALAAKMGKAPADLRIYDPFYCAGRVARLLAKLGFTNVYNKCEDFYSRLQSGTLPIHDVLVTNPPYRSARANTCAHAICAGVRTPSAWQMMIPMRTSRWRGCAMERI